MIGANTGKPVDQKGVLRKRWPWGIGAGIGTVALVAWFHVFAGRRNAATPPVPAPGNAVSKSQAAPAAVTSTVPLANRPGVQRLPNCTGNYLVADATRGAGSTADLEIVEVVEGNRQHLIVKSEQNLCRLSLMGVTLLSRAIKPGAETEETETTDTTSPLPNASGGLSVSDISQIVEPVGDDTFKLRLASLNAIFERGGNAVTDLKLLVENGGAKIVGNLGIYRFLGLVEGDIIVSANGQPVHEASDLIASFMEFDSKQGLEVQVLRDGQARRFRYAAQ